MRPMFELPTLSQGSGPDVVLVHGALGDRRQWDPIAAALAPRFRTHALSRRHHWPGPMPAVTERYTYELHRDDVLRLIDQLGNPVHLVGHSYGAGVVLLAALYAPDRVRSLTLIEPAFGSLLPEAGPGLAEERATRVAALGEVRTLVGAEKHLEAAEVFIDWVQGGPGGFSRLPEAARQGLHDNALTLGPTIAGSQPDVSPASLRGLRMPALVAIGEQTRGFYRLIGEVSAAGIPGARFAKLPGCGHMTIVEAPQRVAALLDDFLAR
jgi:pimeloyl-ACP methyl ester carboxylesterase